MNLLSIAGSDPSSGAGIQRDLHTFTALGHDGFSVVTAVTSQNARGFAGVEPVTPESVGSQIDSVMGDIGIDAIKVGMVYSQEIVRTVASRLEDAGAPAVLDPVIRSTTGGALMRQDAVPDYIGLMLPLASAVTPNVAEAEVLAGMPISSRDEMSRAAQRIREAGADSVIITGLKCRDSVVDCICTGAGVRFASARRIRVEVHGSGCSYSAALAAYMSTGMEVGDAAGAARRYAAESMRSSRRVGAGLAVAGRPGVESELRDAIRDLVRINGIYRLIPEVQMNFGYSRPRPRSIRDVAAVQGRIVRSGRSAIVAGPVAFGGSRHVAHAILEASGRFPAIRAALNIRNGMDTMAMMRSAGMRVLPYDRNMEPEETRGLDDRSVSWGVRQALAGSDSAPDAISHEGGIGKEPMIILFGSGPADVVGKVRRILSA